MKFGKNISVQQEQRPDLHYLQYKPLKKILKRSARNKQTNGSSSSNDYQSQSFERMLENEIDEVNSSFSQHAHAVQDKITALSSEGPQEESSSDRLRQLMSLSRSVDELRKFAVWNAVGVVKILKKRNKLRAAMDGQNGARDPVDMDEERARWLRRQKFFTGTDFAELQASIESLSNALCRERLHELGPEKLPSQLVLAEDDDCPVGMFRDERCPICLEKCSDVVELSTCEHKFCWKCFVLGPIAFAPGEYRFDRCPICRREQPLDPTVNFKTDTNSNSTTNMLLRMAKYVEVDDHPSEEAASPEQQEQQQKNEPSTSSFFSTLPPAVHKSPESSVSSEKSSQQNAAWTGNSGEGMYSQFCSLCCEPLLLDSVVTTPCKHHFHRHCLQRQTTTTCPLCGAKDLPLDLFMPRHMQAQVKALGNWRVCSCESQSQDVFPDGPCSVCHGWRLHSPPPNNLYGVTGVMTSYLHLLPAGAWSKVSPLESYSDGGIMHAHFGADEDDDLSSSDSSSSYCDSVCGMDDHSAYFASCGSLPSFTKDIELVTASVHRRRDLAEKEFMDSGGVAATTAATAPQQQRQQQVSPPVMPSM
ncbi:hypothetical protein FOZ61_008930 [Perkinsus olseni]|uniref:RING-type domain-containing protein n=1 Tax=Perkinsus olseni TaxID=32597 RepID=A0A7J6L8D2_PEROL|nr:hypothetical protein FOZ61_008930 [Perkinsus olseni]KAF4655423.1 hypothetical protein FOL46_008260 [Perkinsus olseni]